MRRLIPRALPLTAVLIVASGCSGSSVNTTTTTAPAAATTTETFSGTLTLNGAFTHPFVVTAAGQVSAVLNTLTPDSTSPIGMSLGTWGGSICQVVLSNDTAIQGSSVVGQATSAGNFCVRVYDAAGTVVNPESYTLQVSHL